MLRRLAAQYIAKESRVIPSLVFKSGSVSRSYSDSADEEQKAARAWFESYIQTGISRRLCHVTFSRSSGPGGQKVNK